jgi:hypothetical protein
MKFQSEVEIRYEKIPEYGDIFTLHDFIESVKNTSFTNDDGTGYYGSDKIMSNVYARPSDIYKGNIDSRTKWTHVIWFNK